MSSHKRSAVASSFASTTFFSLDHGFRLGEMDFEHLFHGFALSDLPGIIPQTANAKKRDASDDEREERQSRADNRGGNGNGVTRRHGT